MKLFAYGTLMWPEILADVIGRRLEGRPARAEQVRRLRVRGEVYPALVPAEGSSVGGVVYEELTADEVAALDQFEGSEYERRGIVVCVEGLSVDAETYFASAGAVLEAEAWTPQELSGAGLVRFRASYKGWS